MNDDPIRIILVDDHKLARESLGLLLGYDERFSIVKDCDNGRDAVEYASLLHPDVMLVDINMSPMNGFEVVKNVLQNNPGIKIIGMSVNNQPAYANRMLQVGARGFVTKSSPLHEMSHAIIEVYNGRQYVSSDVTKIMERR